MTALHEFLVEKKYENNKTFPMTMLKIKLLTYSDMFLEILNLSPVGDFNKVFIDLLNSIIDDKRLFVELFKQKRNLTKLIKNLLNKLILDQNKDDEHFD